MDARIKGYGLCDFPESGYGLEELCTAVSMLEAMSAAHRAGSTLAGWHADDPSGRPPRCGRMFNWPPPLSDDLWRKPVPYDLAQTAEDSGLENPLLPDAGVDSTPQTQQLLPCEFSSGNEDDEEDSFEVDSDDDDDLDRLTRSEARRLRGITSNQLHAALNILDPFTGSGIADFNRHAQRCVGDLQKLSWKELFVIYKSICQGLAGAVRHVETQTNQQPAWFESPQGAALFASALRQVPDAIFDLANVSTASMLGCVSEAAADVALSQAPSGWGWLKQRY